MGETYRNKSLAEQNSLDVAWVRRLLILTGFSARLKWNAQTYVTFFERFDWPTLQDELMSDKFQTLRKYIFGTQAEMMRFRQLIVNLVLATDIFDADNRESRKNRWEQAFHMDGSLPDYSIRDLRATIVMEHIIQVKSCLMLSMRLE